MFKIKKSQIQHNLDKYINHLDLPLATEQLVRYLKYNLIDIDDFMVHTEIGKHGTKPLMLSREQPLTLLRLYKAMDTYQIPFHYLTSKYQEPPRVTKIFNVSYYRVAHFYQFNPQEATQLVQTTIQKLFQGYKRRFAQYMGFAPDTFLSTLAQQRVSKLHFLTMVLGLDLAHNLPLLEYISVRALGKTLEQLDTPNVTYLNQQLATRLAAADQAFQQEREQQLAQVRSIVQQQKLAQLQLLQQLAADEANQAGQTHEVYEAHSDILTHQHVTANTNVSNHNVTSDSFSNLLDAKVSDSYSNTPNDPEVIIGFGNIDQQQQEQLAFAPTVVAQVLGNDGRMHAVTQATSMGNAVTHLAQYPTGQALHHWQAHADSIGYRGLQIASSIAQTLPNLAHFNLIHQAHQQQHTSNDTLELALPVLDDTHGSETSIADTVNFASNNESLVSTNIVSTQHHTPQAIRITSPEFVLPSLGGSFDGGSSSHKSYLAPSRTSNSKSDHYVGNFFSGLNFTDKQPLPVEDIPSEQVAYQLLDDEEVELTIVDIASKLDHELPIYLKPVIAPVATTSVNPLMVATASKVRNNTLIETSNNIANPITPSLAPTVQELQQALVTLEPVQQATTPLGVTLAPQFVASVSQPLPRQGTVQPNPELASSLLAQELAQQITRQPQEFNKAFYNTQLNRSEDLTIGLISAVTTKIKNQQAFAHTVDTTEYQPAIHQGDTVVFSLNPEIGEPGVYLYLDIADKFTTKKIGYLRLLNEEQVEITQLSGKEEPLVLFLYQIRIIGSQMFTINHSM